MDTQDLPESVKEHIAHLERMRQDFVGNVSHELRTPLTVIHGYLESFSDMSEDEMVSVPKSIIEQMFSQSVRMQSIIKDLLLLSQIEKSESQGQRKINVPKLIHKVISDAEMVSNGAHVFTASIDEDLKIQGSKDELRSLFSNLIFNAIRYTPEGGEIKIGWRKHQKMAEFKVEDTGIGVAAKHIPRLTERFYRADKARSRSSGGTGLGLAIVKHVLLRHYGKLTVESELGVGSTFKCEFDIL